MSVRGKYYHDQQLRHYRRDNLNVRSRRIDSAHIQGKWRKMRRIKNCKFLLPLYLMRNINGLFQILHHPCDGSFIENVVLITFFIFSRIFLRHVHNSMSWLPQAVHRTTDVKDALRCWTIFVFKSEKSRITAREFRENRIGKVLREARRREEQEEIERN